MSDSRIIFEDKDFAVIYKQVGDDSQIFFKDFFADKKYAEAVNRLDKPVSGLLIVAFSADIHKKFNALFRSKLVKKEYWAICKKNSDLEAKTFLHCEDFISFNTKKQKAFIVRGEKSKRAAKKAELDFIIVGQGENYDFLKIFPKTGRSHQIRVQLANMGMPIKGDIKYGSKRTEKLGGIRLHAYSLGFTHPKSGEVLQFSSSPNNADSLWSACTESCLEFSTMLG